MYTDIITNLPFNNRAYTGNEIKTKLYIPNKIYIKEFSTGHFSKKEVTCSISITKPKVWIERGYNEK